MYTPQEQCILLQPWSFINLLPHGQVRTAAAVIASSILLAAVLEKHVHPAYPHFTQLLV
jgi:hypothetical protein